MTRTGRTRSRSLFLWIFASAFLAVLHGQALLGKRVPAGDGRGWFLPHFVLLSDHIRQGRLLSWDPWTAGGVPTFTEPQAGAYSPITLAFGLISGGSLTGYNAYAFFMSWLAMTGMFLLARLLRAGDWWAMALGLAYACSGVFTGQPHLSHHVVMAFAPWVLWRLEAYLRQGRPLALLQAGALGGLAGLSAHPAALSYCGLFCGIYLIGRVLLRDSGRKHPVPVTKHAWVLAAIAISVAIIAPVYILFRIEGTGVHTRTSAVSLEMAKAVSLDPRALSSIINPATPVAQLLDGNPWPGTESSLASTYSGVLPILLAGLCLAARPSRWWSWWLLCTGLLFIAMAMGKHLPLHGVLFDAVPPLRMLRHAAIFRLGWLLAVAMLAIYGARELRRLRRRPAGAHPRAIVVLLIIVSLAILVDRGYIAQILATLPEARGSVTHLLLWTCAGAVLVFASLRRSNAAIAGLLILLAVADALSSYHLSSRLMFDPGTGYWSKLSLQHRTDLSLPSWHRVEGARGNASTAIVTRIPALVAHTTLKSGYLRNLADCPALRKMAAGDQRVWFCPNPPAEPMSIETFAALIQAGRSSGQPLMVVHPPASMQSPVPPAQFLLDDADEKVGSPAPGMPAGPSLIGQGASTPLDAELLEYQPETLRFRVQCPADGWVMVTDRWSPGWRAQVNGAAVDVWGANSLFRAIPVKAGDNTIVFSYEPPLRYPLLTLSWLTLGAVALATCWPVAPVRSRACAVAVQA